MSCLKSRTVQKTMNAVALTGAAFFFALPSLCLAQGNVPAAPGQASLTSPGLAPAAASAEGADDEQQNKTRQIAREVSDINERMALMTARLAELDLELKIAQKKAELEGVGKENTPKEKPLKMADLEDFDVLPMGNGKQVPMPAMGLGTIPSAVPDKPRLIAIEGIDGNLRAVLSETGRALQKAVIGENIGKWTLIEIGLDFVTVRSGDQVERLYIQYLPEEEKVASSQGGGSVVPSSANASQRGQ